MSSRLDQQYPELSALLTGLDRPTRSSLVLRIAVEALRRTGVDAPDDQDGSLDAWADGLDDTGWTTDEAGEPAQSEVDFYRARAAFAFRDAAQASKSDVAVADSLYEAIAALGPEAVTEMVSDWSS